LASKPFMKFYVNDYLGDTSHLTTLEHGAYLLLIMAYWQSGKPIPCDRIANIVRMPFEEWKKIEKTLSKFFIVKGKCWEHKRINIELEIFKSKSEAARQSALTRYERTANAERTQSERTAIQIQNQSQIQIQSNTKKKETTKQILTPLEIAFADFAEMRKKIKKPMTEKAQKMIVNQLDKLASTDEAKIAILEQSILHCWQDVYELKEPSQPQKKTGNAVPSHAPKSYVPPPPMERQDPNPQCERCKGTGMIKDVLESLGRTVNRPCGCTEVKLE